jgi:uncharacterized membrane protein
MVVLQLASSQFSPRILRSFFGDRITQLTIGTFVGIFVYSILVLRAVGSFGEPGFVPRLSVTIASLLAIAAVVLLVVFLNHVSLLVQVSHVTATIARATLSRADELYPSRFGDEELADGAQQLERWRKASSGLVMPDRPGYVQRIGLDGIADELSGRAERMAVLVCAGDFVSTEQPIIEVWPPEVAEECREALLGGVAIASERDTNQDVDFGLRQLADTAIKAMSPGINDPATAVTCVGYMRAVIVKLAGRAEPAEVRRLGDLEVVVRRRGFDEMLQPFVQLSRYSGGDAWVLSEILQALESASAAAADCGAEERVLAVRRVADGVLDHARAELVSDNDRQVVERLAADIPTGNG